MWQDSAGGLREQLCEFMGMGVGRMTARVGGLCLLGTVLLLGEVMGGLLLVRAEGCHRRHSFDHAVLLPANAPRGEHSAREGHKEEEEAEEQTFATLGYAIDDEGGSSSYGAAVAVRRRAQADHTECQKDLDAMARDPGTHAFVRVFMMSHCPFAARALQLLLGGRPGGAGGLVQQQAHNPRAATTLRLEFIGVGSDEGSFRSLHGPDEVKGDRLYLCLQDLAPAPSFLTAVWCLSRAPSRVGERQQAEGCFAQAGISHNKVKEIFDCAADGDTASVQMLRESFAKAGRLKVGESPTVYWGMEFHNNTAAATAAQLQSVHVEPGSELLYCGDRLSPSEAPDSFLQANCDTIATFRHGVALGENLHVDETECPMDSPNAEPECIDSRVDGHAARSFSSFMFFTIVLGVFACLASAQSARGNGRRENTATVALRGADGARDRSQGLSAEDIAAFPRMRVADRRGSTCTVCFEPVDDGEDIFELRCGHRHHQQCLTDWLQRKSECPDCRGPIQLEDEIPGPPPPLVCVNSRPLPE
eukprot:COSAG02_NODE_10807_length_1855_cov_1.517084_2_plen_531_part_01